MRNFHVALSALALAFTAVMAAPASAQLATRTWVSGVGDDLNTCSRTAPCKTFAGAFANTAAGGAINVLDPGGFGTVTITKSITIRSDHVEAGVLTGASNGIIVNAAATDKVILDGLDIDGNGSGLNGVSVLQVGKLIVTRTKIRNFTQNGINMAATNSGAHLFVNDSEIAYNNGGVFVAGTNNIASLTNSYVLGNTTFSLNASVSGAIIGVQGCTVNDSPAGISRVAGAQVISVGPSNLVTGSGSFTATVPFQ